MIKIIKIILTVISSIIVCGILVVILAAFDFGGVSDLAKTIKADVLSWVDTDAAAKEVADKFVKLQSDALEKIQNIDTSEAKEVLDNINIKEWDTVDAPEGLVEESHLGGTALGYTIELMFYTDHKYAAIILGDHVTTLSIPDSAQQYVEKLRKL